MSDEKKHHDINSTPIDAELDTAAEQAESIADNAEPSFNLTTRRDERIFAFNLIYAMDRFDYTTDLAAIVAMFAEGFAAPVQENSFAIKLAQAVVDNRDALDQEIVPFLRNWKIDRLGCCTRLILRMAVQEMNEPGAIASVIINEAVELAKLFSEKDAYKFINGTLDEIAKKKKTENESEQGDVQEE